MIINDNAFSQDGAADEQNEPYPAGPPPSYAQHSLPSPVSGGSTSSRKGLASPSNTTGLTTLTHDASSSYNNLHDADNNVSPSQLVDPSQSIPPSFSRMPPVPVSYEPFQPIFLIAKGSTLDKGFPVTLPPSTARPHPFSSHDIREDDWRSFLTELQAIATLTAKDVVRSHLPLVSMIPIVSPLASLGVQKYMKGQKRHKVVKVIEIWNHHFFQLRRVQVILMRGKTLLNEPIRAPDQSEGSSSASSMDIDWVVKEMSAHWDGDVFRLLVAPY